MNWQFQREVRERELEAVEEAVRKGERLTILAEEAEAQAFRLLEELNNKCMSEKGRRKRQGAVLLSIVIDEPRSRPDTSGEQRHGGATTRGAVIDVCTRPHSSSPPGSVRFGTEKCAQVLGT